MFNQTPLIIVIYIVTILFSIEKLCLMYYWFCKAREKNNKIKFTPIIPACPKCNETVYSSDPDTY